MKRHYISLIALIVLTLQGIAQVKITEIMYNPKSPEDNWEWVELHNPTSNPINLNGYVIDDGNSTFQTSSNVEAVIIPANGTVVLFNDDDINASDFQDAWGSSITTVKVTNWGAMGLNNSGDHVGVWDSYTNYQKDTLADGSRAFNHAVSHVDYDDDGTIWPADNGFSSIYLKDITADVSQASNWVLSSSTDGISSTSSAAAGNSGQDIANPGKTPPVNTNFTLQLLHYADVDGNEELALDIVDEFSGLVNAFKNDPTHGSNSLLVSSGDLIIPGPRFYAAENSKIRNLTGSNEPGHLDIFFANQMGVQASAVGNHELDAGAGEFHDAAFRTESRNGVTFPGSAFPWLASNIDFSGDFDFAKTIGKDGDDIANLHSKTADYAVTTINGEVIGLIGATTPTLPSITNAGYLDVSPTSRTNEDLAKVIQNAVDSLKNKGVNKIILLAHMQQIAIEKALAGLLDGVDIIVSGGSNTRMGDANDVLYTTDGAFDENYPFLTTDASGKPVAVVSVDGDYKYLGRLVIEFDNNGNIDPNSIDENVSGTYASTLANVSSLGGVANAKITEVRDSVLSVINSQYQNVVGYSEVYLDGRRSQVRTQETNLGNLTADANLWYANQLNPSDDDAVLVSIKNGGGIRTEIGTSKLPAGSDNPEDMEFFPPANNAVTEGHLRATLRFNNGLVRLTLTAQELKDVIEHSLSGYAPGVTGGAFPQIGGMQITYNPLLKASKVDILKGADGNDSIVVAEQGSRIREMIINKPDGTTMDVVKNGELNIDPSTPINVVTLNFLANGGDDYPFTIANYTNRRLNYYDGQGYGDPMDFPDGTLTNDPGKSSDISSTGGEQDALAEYMSDKFDFIFRAFNTAETPEDEDMRIVRTLRVMDKTPAKFEDELNVKLAGTFQVPGNVFDESAAEIPAFDTKRKQVFFTDANSNQLHVLSINDPKSPTLIKSIDLDGGPNSVAVHDDIVAVAVESDPKQDPGMVVFYAADDFSKLGEVTVGALPDMVTFNEDGTKVITANEGEPSGDYLNDPEGSVSIVTIDKDNLSNSSVATADFNAFDASPPAGVRIFGRSKKGDGDKADDFATTLSQDMEPEYVAVSGNNAYVVCQENNTLAIVDIENAQVTSLLPLGTIDHSIAGNGLDASNKDDGIYISQWPIKGMFLPDAITAFEADGSTYIISANEGDAREYLYDLNGEEELSFTDEARVKDLTLDPDKFPFADLLQSSEQLGRLKTSLVDGDTDGDGDHDEIYSFGTRSFTIWDPTNGSVVWDSKNAFEQILAQRYPDNFNATNDENNFDNRSDDKGPEPEGVVTGVVNGRTYAFVGLERVGGIVSYDITDPTNPTFANYITTRDFSGNPEEGTSGDLAPEGLAFIPSIQSPTNKALLVVTFEVSGSVSIFELGKPALNVEESTQESIALQVYPNPSNTDVTFRLNNTEVAELTIYNPMGSIIHNHQFNGSTTLGQDILNTAGVHFYQLSNQGKVTTGKFVITK